MVDDYFAEGWPGVSEGVHAFMLRQGGAGSEQQGGRPASSARAIVPFFVGFNKVLFTTEDFSGTYQDALMSGQHIIGLSHPCTYLTSHAYHACVCVLVCAYGPSDLLLDLCPPRAPPQTACASCASAPYDPTNPRARARTYTHARKHTAPYVAFHAPALALVMLVYIGMMTPVMAGDGTMKVKMQQMFGYPVVVMTEEVHCRKKTRGLLPGEQCPAGFKCS